MLENISRNDGVLRKLGVYGLRRQLDQAGTLSAAEQENARAQVGRPLPNIPCLKPLVMRMSSSSMRACR